jgi:acyl-CoA reductase-like NAD-dependent aldehyde dehydrogenase
MVPWNYPLFLAIGPLTAALAAGNRALIKMPELTPAFSALFERLIAQYFAPEEVAVINGDAQVAQAFSLLPFDHLLFTGSTKVGHDVMRAASTHLTPVTLELGGKSPALICPGDGSEAVLRKAAEAILRGKCVNAGQTCIAPDYVLLPEAQREAFIRIAAEVFNRLYPAERAGKDYAAVVSERHYQRLQQSGTGCGRAGCAGSSAGAEGNAIQPASDASGIADWCAGSDDGHAGRNFRTGAAGGNLPHTAGSNRPHQPASASAGAVCVWS